MLDRRLQHISWAQGIHASTSTHISHPLLPETRQICRASKNGQSSHSTQPSPTTSDPAPANGQRKPVTQQTEQRTQLVAGLSRPGRTPNRELPTASTQSPADTPTQPQKTGRPSSSKPSARQPTKALQPAVPASPSKRKPTAPPAQPQPEGAAGAAAAAGARVGNAASGHASRATSHGSHSRNQPAAQDAHQPVANSNARTPASIAPTPASLGHRAWRALCDVVRLCEAEGLDYCLKGWAAAMAQGVDLPEPTSPCRQQLSSFPAVPAPSFPPHRLPSEPYLHHHHHSSNQSSDTQEGHAACQPSYNPQPMLLDMPASLIPTTALPAVVQTDSTPSIPPPLPLLTVSVQWDGLPSLHKAACEAYHTGVSQVLKVPNGSCFAITFPPTQQQQQQQVQPQSLPQQQKQKQQHSNQHQQLQQRQQNQQHQHNHQHGPSVETLRLTTPVAATTHNAHPSPPSHEGHAQNPGQPIQLVVCCENSAVLAADPSRTRVQVSTPSPSSTTHVWAESLWSLGRSAAQHSLALGALHHHAAANWVEPPNGSRMAAPGDSDIQNGWSVAAESHNGDGVAVATLSGEREECQSAGVTAPAQHTEQRQGANITSHRTVDRHSKRKDDVEQSQSTDQQGANNSSPAAADRHNASKTRHAERLAPPDAVLAARVSQRLAALQSQAAAANSGAWAGSDTYGAWVRRFGAPGAVAGWVTSDPAARLAGGLLKAMQAEGPLSGCRVTNLMGSHGLKALALACITGRTVTVVDVSPGNARYAREVAAHASLPLRYIVSDVLRLAEAVPLPSRAPEACTSPEDALWGAQQWVVMEQGVLHYFLDLEPLFATIHQLLAPGGRLLLRDFHPLSTKVITSKGNKHKVTGDYFDCTLAQSAAAFTKYQAPSGAGGEAEVFLRRWTLGEVVTACAGAGLMLVSLEEEPGPKAADRGLPKTFTIVARKPLDRG